MVRDVGTITRTRLGYGPADSGRLLAPAITPAARPCIQLIPGFIVMARSQSDSPSLSRPVRSEPDPGGIFSLALPISLLALAADGLCFVTFTSVSNLYVSGHYIAGPYI